MPVPVKKIRNIDPTVVAAQPGYRVATICPRDGNPVTIETKPEDLWVGFDPIVAWIIHPYVEDTAMGAEIVNATTYAVTPDGIINYGDHYTVAPDGSWSWPDGPELKSENDARKHFIDRRFGG